MTAAPRTQALARPLRGVKVYPRPTIGACVPTSGKVEPDLEPLPGGRAPSCAFACTAEPEPAAEYEESLAGGVMREPAAEAVTDPEARRGDPVGARVVVRTLSWHRTDTREQAFLYPRPSRCGRRCAAWRRTGEPLLIETRVRLFF